MAFLSCHFSFPPSPAHFLLLSSCLSWSFPALLVHTGKQDFYRTGKALSVAHEGRLEVEFPLPFTPERDRLTTSHTIHSHPPHTIQHTLQSSDRPSHRPTHIHIHTLVAPTLASLSQFNLSPEHDDKMLANVSPGVVWGPGEAAP